MAEQDKQTQQQSGGISAGSPDQTDEPKRTPSQAEGGRQIVEEDLGQETEQAGQRGPSTGAQDQTYQPGRPSQAEGTRETVEEDLDQKTE